LCHSVPSPTIPQTIHHLQSTRGELLVTLHPIPDHLRRGLARILAASPPRCPRTQLRGLNCS
jgi:hypothetical protein